MSDVSVDRAAVRQMVEDFCRSQYLYQQNIVGTQPHLTPEQSQSEGLAFAQRFFDRVEATAVLMSPEQGDDFRKMVDEEYGFLIKEIERNPTAALQRLGINMRYPPPVYHRQGIGEMAVRTAVRTTIWELIFSLFRR